MKKALITESIGRHSFFFAKLLPAEVTLKFTEKPQH